MTGGLPRSVAVVAPSPVPFRHGGAERLWAALVGALESAGVAVELLKLPVREHTLPDLVDAYEQFALLDLSHFDAVVTGKYPAWMVDHPHHVVWMLHPLRGLYDSYRPEVFEDRRLPPDPDLGELTRLLAEGPRGGDPFEVLDRVRAAADHLGPAATDADGPLSLPGPLARAVVQFLDRWALDGRRVRRHAAISAVVAGRPDYFPSEVEVEVVHPPSGLTPAPPGPLGHELLVVSRLEPIKRVELAIDAFRTVEDPRATLTVVGDGPDRSRLEELAASDPRVRFTGRVGDAELRERYATARAVVVTPEREDFGYVALEAHQHARPVLTVDDAGGPTELVRDGVDGLVVAPRVDAVAGAMIRLLSDDDSAETLGRAGLDSAGRHRWPEALHRLLATGTPTALTGTPTGRTGGRRGRLVALSTYPVAGWPGGGPERATHLLGALARHGWEVELIDLAAAEGGPEGRRNLADGVWETTVRCSARHHDAEARLRLVTGDVSISDIAAVDLWPATPAFARELSAALEGAVGAVLVQPYLYTAVRALAPDLPVVCETHNHERALKSGLLPGNEGGRWLLDRVARVEAASCLAARLITAVTEEDRAGLATDHSLDPDRIAVIPNGVDTAAVRFTPPEERARRRDDLLAGLDAPPRVHRVALFVGSGHQPNIDAGRALLELAPTLPDVMFVLAGRHSSFLGHQNPGANTRLLGPVSDAQLAELQAAADVALNPMAAGSGSNLKLLSYLAAGIPVVSTPVGSRGVPDAGTVMTVAGLDGFGDAVRSAVAAPDPDRVAAARKLVEDHFDWRSLGDRFAALVSEVLDPDAPGVAHGPRTGGEGR